MFLSPPAGKSYAFLFVLFDHILKNEPGAFRIYVVIIMILKGWHMEDKI